MNIKIQDRRCLRFFFQFKCQHARLRRR